MSVGDIRSVRQGCLNSYSLSAITQTLPYTGRILRFGVFYLSHYEIKYVNLWKSMKGEKNDSQTKTYHCCYQRTLTVFWPHAGCKCHAHHGRLPPCRILCGLHLFFQNLFCLLQGFTSLYIQIFSFEIINGIQSDSLHLSH